MSHKVTAKRLLQQVERHDCTLLMSKHAGDWGHLWTNCWPNIHFDSVATSDMSGCSVLHGS